MLLNSREPIALHWPVMELAPVPGRPMLPVISARLMIACAVRIASWPWLTPIVHQKETRLPLWMSFGEPLELLVPKARTRLRRRVERELRDECRQTLEAAGVRVDERLVDPAAGDEQVGHAIEQHRDRSWAGAA